MGRPTRRVAICDELAAVHENVTCLHKENGGLSDARNYGLDRSHGEWVSFVDSDDYVSPVWIEALAWTAFTRECAIAAVSGGHDFNDGEDVLLYNDLGSIPEPCVLPDLEVQKDMLYQQITMGAAWLLYRRDVLGENPFPKGLYYEDLASTYKFVRRAGKVAIIDCHDAYRHRSTCIILYRRIFTPSATPPEHVK